MYKAFIEPDLQAAHIKIINKFNPFTGFQNPTYILKVDCFSLNYQIYMLNLAYEKLTFIVSHLLICYIEMIPLFCHCSHARL